jgi:hypothetical protein
MQAIERTWNRRTTMKAKNLILTLSLTLGAGAAVAAIKFRDVEPGKSAPAVETTSAAIPRVVVNAPKTQSAETPVARVVVFGHRADGGRAVTQSN